MIMARNGQIAPVSGHDHAFGRFWPRWCEDWSGGGEGRDHSGESGTAGHGRDPRRRPVLARRRHITAKHERLTASHKEPLLIILGVILLIISIIAKINIGWTIGIVVLLVGAILALLGMTGHQVGRRRYYF